MLLDIRRIRRKPPKNEAKVREFCQAMEAGEEFPPVQVSPFGDGTFRLLDGRHRTEAAARAGFGVIECAVLR